MAHRLIAFEPLEPRALLAAPYPLGETFQLHSNPGAGRTIYLDFNGHTTTGMTWNSAYNGGQAIVTEPYSFEGDGSFTDAEMERIQRIWQRVSEDYIPFDVNVTTADPGVESLRLLGPEDDAWGIRVVLGGTGSWFSDDNGGGLFGGAAYTNSFIDAADRPAFVFSANLANSGEKQVADAASHEAGHSLGLDHDGRHAPGQSEQPYYSGHGSGLTSWGTLMGNSYARTLSQWSKGEYQYANNVQDDLAIITKPDNGVSYRVDDHGNTRPSASTLGGNGQGIIERNTDSDYFSLSILHGGVLNIDIAPFEPGPNLDILAELYNASGQLLTTANPLEQLSASISIAVLPGTYYLRVLGTGKGDPSIDGYSNYGSLGRYFITAQTPPPPQPITVTGTGGADTFHLDLAANGDLLLWKNAPKTGSPTQTFLGGSYTTVTLDGQGGNDLLTMEDAGAATPIDLSLVSGMTLMIDSDLRLGRLELESQVNARFSAGGAKVIHANDLAINASATLDLNDNDLVLHPAGAPEREALLDLVQARVGSARNGGGFNNLWNGTGITSAAAREDVSGLTGLAVAVRGGDVWVKHTWNGDANADGRLTADDYARIDRGFLRRGADYGEGNFNFDGVIDLDDYALLDQAYLGQSGVL